MTQIKVDYINHMGDDLTVVNAARVSFDKESSLVEGELSSGDEKLIHYLAKHKHLSPFGHCFASFRVTAPVFVARQLVKHEYLRWNEISRRYVDSEPEFYTPKAWREKAVDKKQGSGKELWIGGDAQEFYSFGETGLSDIGLQEESLALYNTMIKGGVAPEMARMVLPQSMMTSWYWSGSLDAFVNMCNLRCKPDTQKETQLVANQIDDIMTNKFPVSWAALRGWE